MNAKRLDEIHKQINNHIKKKAGIKGDWEKAWIIAYLNQGSDVMYGNYIQKGSSDILPLKVGFDILDLFEEMQVLMSKDSSKRWIQAKYILMNTGVVDIQFSYEPNINPYEDFLQAQ